jgi:integrase
MLLLSIIIKNDTIMSTNHKKGHLTKSGPMSWDKLMGLVRKLEKDEKYLLASYITLSQFSGFRVSDIRLIRYDQIVGQTKLSITETKTGKLRTIDLNDELVEKITKYYSLMGRTNPSGFILESSRSKGQSVNVSYLNKALKLLNMSYGLKHDNFTTHTLRRSFGKKIYETYGKSEHSLVLLSKVFSHSAISITREYIGLEQEAITNVYLNL